MHILLYRMFGYLYNRVFYLLVKKFFCRDLLIKACVKIKKRLNPKKIYFCQKFHPKF